MTPRGNRIGRLFTREQLETARLKKIENLFYRNRERWAPFSPIQGESEVSVNAVWFEQARHEVGIFIAAVWVNGTEASVF